MRRLPIFLSIAALLGAIIGPANATVFDFTTTDVSVEQLGISAPTSTEIDGTITLSNNVCPAGSFHPPTSLHCPSRSSALPGR
jgi:hypothetical protein